MLKPNPIQLDGVDLATLFEDVADFERIGLAVSGGPDSLGLLLLVRAWCDLMRNAAPEVFVYSVDHRLRPEAAAEAAMAAALAGEFGFEPRVLEWREDKPQTGVQAKARQARYELIGAIMSADDVPVLLTAHHAEDQAETVLMRMAHGSGLGGLGGMGAWAEVEGLRLHRPLLRLKKAQLQEIVTTCGIAAASDPSNFDTHYERVRWRQAMPQLAELGLSTENLGRLARRLQRAEAALAHIAEQEFATLVRFDELGVAHMPLAALAELPAETALRVLALVFVHLGRTAPRLEQLETLQADLRSPGFSGTCLSGVQVQPLNNDILAHVETGRMQSDDLTIPAGETHLWDGRFEVFNGMQSHVLVRASRGLTRPQAEQFCGRGIAVPMSAVAAAPSVFDAAGRLVALGSFTCSEQVRVKLATL